MVRRSHDPKGINSIAIIVWKRLEMQSVNVGRFEVNCLQ